MGLTCVGLGSASTLFYIVNVKEPSLSREAIEREAAYQKAIGREVEANKNKNAKGKKPGDWLKEAQFYIFGCVYMFARISLNTTATMMPLYLSVVSKFEAPAGKDTPVAIAAVPLVSYICSLLFSVTLQNWITQRFRNRLIPMAMSVFVTAIGSMPMAFLGSGNWRYAIYPAAAIQGVGNAMMLNTGTSCISDVIGQDNTSAAFVYGSYSFADKFSNGFLLFWLVAQYSADANALQWIISIIPTLSAIFCTLCTWIGITLYAEKLAKISTGSVLNKHKAKLQAQKQAQAQADREKLLTEHQGE